MEEKIKKFWERLKLLDKFLLAFLVLGFLISIVSLIKGVFLSQDVTVEHLSNETASSSGGIRKLVVDVSGAVESPGVYELSVGSRVKDALVAARGIASSADREYISKQMNLAQQLKDGQKIYIPFLNNTPTVLGYPETKNSQKLVNVNVATLEELDTLWGIGKARAESIVKNRPYTTLEEMVEKKAITSQILERNRDAMSVY